MKELSRKLLAPSRQLASSLSIAYWRKWLPATVLLGIVAGVASIAFFSAITWATELFLGLGAKFTPPAPAMVANKGILPIPRHSGPITTVERVMSTNLVVIHPDETLEQALELMVAKRVAVLPAVDRKDPTKLLGLVTRRSVIEAYESEAKKMMGEVHYA